MMKLQHGLGSYQSIAVSPEILNKAGFDSLAETIEVCYKQVMQEALALIKNERERIKVAPKLCYLIKEFPQCSCNAFLVGAF